MEGVNVGDISMSGSTIILEGRVTPEGTLELAEKLTLPPGPVRVVVEELPSIERPDVMEVLARIHRGQAERGFRGRTKEEVDADVAALRDEWEERMEEIERLQEESARKKE